MTPVARRYALALYEEARARNEGEAVDDGMIALGETLDASRDLRSVLASPVVSRTKKAAVVARLFGDRLPKLVTSLMLLLIKKEREDLAVEVVAAYRALHDKRAGIVEARVRTARPLTADEAESLRKALETRTGSGVRLRLAVEPALIGGLVVRLGDRVYDGSLRHQLGLLREQLVTRAQIAN
ncbi:MAG TPA: ATP synthase F1 subunit delta [Rhodothermales bacterium]|nr:ATP synthase F1 subunit delta [Rhodothermales bacterium]